MSESGYSPSRRGRGLGGGDFAKPSARSPPPPPARRGGVSVQAACTQFLATTTGRLLARLALVVILLAMWQVLPSRGLRFWMSGPVEIVARLWSWVLDGSLWENLGATLLAMILGYLIGTAV